MPITVTFDHIDKNRVFVDTGRVCTGACLYCYVPEFKSSALPASRKKFLSAELAVQAIQNETSFSPGVYGTAISMGCYADPLHSSCINRTQEILPSLLRLGNPIQMASKCFAGSAELAGQICAQQQYPGQFTLLVTITSFSHASEIEPGAPTPEERLQVLDVFQQAGINTAIFIKPILPGITEYDTDAFVEALLKFKVPNCVMGLFYANPRILNKFKKMGLPIQQIHADMLQTHHFPNDSQKVLIQSSDDELRDQFYETLRQCVDADVFKTSMCVVAHRLKIPDPMRTWRRYPDLCVNCQDCETLVADLPPELQEHYRG